VPKQLSSESRPWLVIGGGMVGGAAAVAIAETGRQVVVAEPNPVNSWEMTDAHDLRISAITQDNCELLELGGVWEQLSQLRFYPFTELAVREEGTDWVEFEAHNKGNLGIMVENKALQHALFKVMDEHPNIELKQAGFKCVDFTASEVSFSDGSTQDFSWLVGADGANSRVRSEAGIGVSGRRYQERCLLVNVKTSGNIPSRTWQTFKGKHIFSLLPLAEDRACLIVYANPEEIRHWESDRDALETVLRNEFQWAVGEAEILSSGSFPLQQQHAFHYTDPAKHVVLLGDAAHSIHPLAGQGVNLGLRDVRQLYSVLREYGEDTAISVPLKKALRRQQVNNMLMAGGLDIIARAFRSENPIVQTSRRLGIGIAAKNRGLKQILSWAASGKA